MNSSKSSIRSDCEKISIETEELSKLVCPVCYEYMKPPIYQCEKGHGICEFCHELLPECPLCQSPLTQERNKDLEILTELVLFPCKQCKNSFSLDDLQQHKCTNLTDAPVDITCLIGQIYGDCNWRGPPKDMIEHCSIKHPNNYWTKPENITKWNFCHLYNIGIQNIYIIDLTEVTFIIVQKFDSNIQSLIFNISCECEKDNNEQYVYDIELFFNENNKSQVFRKIIENDYNIMTSLPNSNEISIPVDEVSEFLSDNNFVNYKVIIHKKADLSTNFYQDNNEMKYFVETTENDVKLTCVQRTWYSITDVYNYLKKRLTCS